MENPKPIRRILEELEDENISLDDVFVDRRDVRVLEPLDNDSDDD